MRRTTPLLVTVVLAMVVFAPGATATPPTGSAPIRFHEVIYRVPTYWWGAVSGDIAGMVKYTGDPAHANMVEGTVVHFYELFKICVGAAPIVSGCTESWTGSYISGRDEGVFNKFNPGGRWSFRADGLVTAASPDLAYLIGYKFHENGVTTDPSTPPLMGEGDAFISQG